MAHATNMHAHSPASYSISLLMHGALACAILFSAHALREAQNKNTNQIIELVDGEGDNYMVTEAPAPGAPEAVEYHPPAAIPRTVVEPDPEPVVEAATQTPVATPPDSYVVPPAKKNPPVKTEPKKTVEPKKAEPKNTTFSKADFDKLYGAKNEKMPSRKIADAKVQNSKPVVAPKIGKGFAGGVAGGTGSAAGAGGTALTAGERDMMEAYFKLLGERIKEAQEKPEGLSNSLSVIVEYQVAAKRGTIGAVKIIRSSGNRAFDDSVLKAIRTVKPIGDRPDGISGPRRTEFFMREE